MKKRLLTILLLVVMILSMVACGSGQVNGGTGETESDAAKAESNGTGENGDSYEDHLVITVSSLAYTEKFDDEMYDYVCEKYNMELDHYQLTLNDCQEKTRMWIYSGEMPDAAYTFFDWNTGYSEYVDFVNQGLIKPLPDGWKERWPNLAKSIAVTGFEEELTIDGKIYAIAKPVMCNFAPVTEHYVHHGITYRKDWAEELGFDFSDYTITVEELADFVAAAKEKYGATGINGAPTLLPNLFVSLCNPGFNNFYRDESGQFVWGPGQESTLEGIKLMRKYYENGTIDPDYYLGQVTTPYEKWASGLVSAAWSDGVVNVYANRATELGNQFPELDPWEATGIALPVSEEGIWYGQTQPNNFGVTMFSPEISEEKMERMLDFYDWMATEDGQIFASMGVPDVHYKKEADGTLVNLRPVGENGQPTEIITELPFSLFCGTAAICNDDFNFVNPGAPENAVNDITALYELRKAQDNGEGNVYHWSREYTFYVGTAKNNYTCDVYAMINNLVVTKEIDVDAEWAAWVESMQSMVQPVLDELNAAYDS